MDLVRGGSHEDPRLDPSQSRVGTNLRPLHSLARDLATVDLPAPFLRVVFACSFHADLPPPPRRAATSTGSRSRCPASPAVIRFLAGSPPLDPGEAEVLSQFGGRYGFPSSRSGSHRRLLQRTQRNPRCSDQGARRRRVPESLTRSPYAPLSLSPSGAAQRGAAAMKAVVAGMELGKSGKDRVATPNAFKKPVMNWIGSC